MSYKVPTFEELHGFLVGFWKALFPLSNVGTRFSYHWKRLRAYAGGITDLHAHIDSAQNDVMPDTSLGSFLSRWGKAVGVAKKSATGARGTNALRVYGTVAAPFNANLELTHTPTGFRFQNTESGVIGASGYVDVDVAAIDTGAATRLNVGEALSFTAPPGGITTIAKIVVALTTDGFDVEQDQAYSVRVNDEFSKPRMGGHEDDFVKWALQLSIVAQAYCYPNRAGVGTVDVVGMHTGNGTARSLTAPEQATLLAYLKTLAPSQVSGTGGSLRVLNTIADPQPVEITVTPNGDADWAFDWDDSVPLVVLAITSATRTIQWTTSNPGSLVAGVRITLRGVASVQDGTQFVVESIPAADKVVLAVWPAIDPAATDIAYSGGPLVDPIRDAVIAHINGEIVYADSGVPIAASVAGVRGLRLKILAEGIGPANPAGKYGAWSGALVRAELGKLAAYPTGARNVVVVTPAADHEATDDAFPSDGQIHFITPSVVLVRKG